MNTRASLTRRKALFAALALGGAAALAEIAKPRRRVAEAYASARLEDLVPRRFGVWREDERLAPFVGPEEPGRPYGVYDQVLERGYVDAGDERVMLSVAYGMEQSLALESHSPDVCYTAHGFEISGLHALLIPLGRSTLPATRLHATMPGRSEPITYWTVLGNEVVDRSSARWRKLTGGLRGEVLDMALVRVSSIASDAAPAYALHARFAQALLAALSASGRPRIFGRTVET